jgi:hypothetical protein
MALINRNIVVTSPAIAQGIFTQLFFMRCGAVAENEFQEGCVFLDQMCQVNAPGFTFIAPPAGIVQFTPNSEAGDDDQELLIGKFMPIIRAMGETPFAAVGLNFTWHECENEPEVIDISRRLFFRQDIIPFTYFTDADARFGSYMSTDFEVARMKLDIKPIYIGRANEPHTHRLSFSFNFHRELPAENAADSIEEVVRIWNDAMNHSRSIIENTMRGGA